MSATDIQLCVTTTTVTNDVGINEWNGVLLATTNPLPNAVAGAAGGVFIAGANAATTVDFTGSLSGSVGSVTTKTGYALATTGLDLVTAWTTNITGNLSGSVGSVTTKTGYALVATGLDLVTAWTVDITGSLSGSVGSLTGHTNQTGDSFVRIGAAGAGLTAIPWNAAWDAEVESEVNDAIDTVISELGVAAPTATPTLRTGLMLLYMAMRNKLVAQTSGTDALELYNAAGTLITQKLVTDVGGDYTEAQMT